VFFSTELQCVGFWQGEVMMDKQGDKDKTMTRECCWILAGSVA